MRVPLKFVLLLALAAAVGSGCGSDSDIVPGENANDQARIQEKERIVRFWELHREAGRRRVAGDIQEAIDLYEAALRLDSTHEDALYYLANAYLETDRPRPAAQALDRLIKAHPESARGLNRRGELRLCYDEAQLDTQAAAADFERALAINQEETGPMLRLAQVALLKGEPDNARQWLEAIIGTHASSIEAHFLLGLIDWRSGNTEAAQTRFELIGGLMADTPSDPVIGEGDRKKGAAIQPGEQQTCPLMLELLAGILDPASPLSASTAFSHADARLRAAAASGAPR